MVQNRKKGSKKIHLFNHFPTSSGVSEWASERTNERSGARKQSQHCGGSEWVSAMNDRANEGASSPVFRSGFLVILDYSASRKQARLSYSLRKAELLRSYQKRDNSIKETLLLCRYRKRKNEYMNEGMKETVHWSCYHLGPFFPLHRFPHSQAPLVCPINPLIISYLFFDACTHLHKNVCRSVCPF